MSGEIQTHNLKVTFGKYKGELWTRVPISYLNWLVNQPESTNTRIAKKEIRRRGSKVPEVFISGHAIDRASLRCLKYWKKDRKEKEGLHAWLARLTKEAGEQWQTDRVTISGIVLVLERGELYPSLKTVFPAKDTEQAERKLKEARE